MFEFKKLRADECGTGDLGFHPAEDSGVLKEELNFQSQGRVVNGELVRVVVLGLVGYREVILCPFLFFLEMQKEQRLVVIALARTEKKTGGECSYTARFEPKELRCRATLC